MVSGAPVAAEPSDQITADSAPPNPTTAGAGLVVALAAPRCQCPTGRPPRPTPLLRSASARHPPHGLESPGSGWVSRDAGRSQYTQRCPRGSFAKSSSRAAGAPERGNGRPPANPSLAWPVTGKPDAHRPRRRRWSDGGARVLHRADDACAPTPVGRPAVGWRRRAQACGRPNGARAPRWGVHRQSTNRPVRPGPPSAVRAQNLARGRGSPTRCCAPRRTRGRGARVSTLAPDSRAGVRPIGIARLRAEPRPGSRETVDTKRPGCQRPGLAVRCRLTPR